MAGYVCCWFFDNTRIFMGNGDLFLIFFLDKDDRLLQFYCHQVYNTLELISSGSCYTPQTSSPHVSPVASPAARPSRARSRSAQQNLDVKVSTYFRTLSQTIKKGEFATLPFFPDN
jgi:hypothetical protein